MVYLFIQPSKFKIMSFEYAIGNPLMVYETEFEIVSETNDLDFHISANFTWNSYAILTTRLQIAQNY